MLRLEVLAGSPGARSGSALMSGAILRWRSRDDSGVLESGVSLGLAAACILLLSQPGGMWYF